MYSFYSCSKHPNIQYWHSPHPGTNGISSGVSAVKSEDAKSLARRNSWPSFQPPQVEALEGLRSLDPGRASHLF